MKEEEEEELEERHSGWKLAREREMLRARQAGGPRVETTCKD